MADRATRLSLDVRLEAFDQPIGVLDALDDGGVRFTYAPGYLADHRAHPISMSLPLDEAPRTDAYARNFFQNLLPENTRLDDAIRRHGLDYSDVVGLLHHVGADCSGAISCLPRGAAPVKTPGSLHEDYRPLSLDEIADICGRLADRRPLSDLVDDASPLAGVQNKIALAVLPDGRFATPRDGLGVPTTHILKVPNRSLSAEAQFEAAATALAGQCGLEAAEVSALEIGGVQALLIKRFDRHIDDRGLVTRIHQEDFVQALGLPPSAKYERRASAMGAFSAAAIQGVLSRTLAPATENRRFVLATLFNICVGNADNHGKNHALLYDQGPTPRVAPFYDLLPTKLNAKVVDDFAFRIGQASQLGELTDHDLQAFFQQFALRPAAAARFVQDAVRPMMARLDEAAARLPLHLKRLDDLIGRETETLADILHLDLALRPRDHFEASAGGWAGS